MYNNLTIGQQYHIYNGYATDLDNLWYNNTVLENISIENSVTVLHFKCENNKTILIDSDFMLEFNYIAFKQKQRIYMFLQKKHEKS